MVAGNIFHVPWPDFSEWDTVREQIFSSNIQDKITAYHTILMWKLRFDSVPAYIECTHSLLQVMVKEYEMTKKNEPNSLLFNELDLQLSYSTALIRFVNHVLSINFGKNDTLYLAAKTQNIPDWIINMRHDVTHGQDLPALDALHIAAELSFKWLLDYYWGNPDSCEQQTVKMSHFNIDAGLLEDIDTDVQNVFRKFFDIWELYSSVKFKRIQFINEIDREFILHLEEMLSLNVVYFNNLKNHAADKLQNIVDVYNRIEENGECDTADLCRFKDLKTILIDYIKFIIKTNDSLKHSFVMSLFDTSFLSENCFHGTKWKKILYLFQEIDAFSLLLKILFQMAGNGDKGASKWLEVLQPSITHLQKQWAIYKVYRRENKQLNKNQSKRKVQSSGQTTTPNLMIPLQIFKPPVINLEMMKNVLLNPELLSVDSIVGYLKFVKPALPDSTVEMIRDLVSLHVNEQDTEMEQTNEDKIFTVDDLERVMETEESLVNEEASCSDGWTRSSINLNIWNKCPLGLLPFQKKVDCNLPVTVKWGRQETNRKRVCSPLLKHSTSIKRFKEV